MKLISNWGFIVLAIYLILVGITSIIGGLSIPPIVFGILAIIAGILILIGK